MSFYWYKLSLASDKPQICLRIPEFSSFINFWHKNGQLDSYFFENSSICSKVMIVFVFGFNFLAKKFNFRPSRWFWRCYSYFWRWNRLTFEPVDGFSNFKNVNWSEFNFKETLFSTCFCYDVPFPIYRDAKMVSLSVLHCITTQFKWELNLSAARDGTGLDGHISDYIETSAQAFAWLCFGSGLGWGLSINF